MILVNTSSRRWFWNTKFKIIRKCDHNRFFIAEVTKNSYHKRTAGSKSRGLSFLYECKTEHTVSAVGKFFRHILPPQTDNNPLSFHGVPFRAKALRCHQFLLSGICQPKRKLGTWNLKFKIKNFNPNLRNEIWKKFTHHKYIMCSCRPL